MIRLTPSWKARLAALTALACAATAACLTPVVPASVHTWWEAQGPVLPHDTFPTDCALCHVGDSWETLVPEFEFDHEAETGVALYGAHTEAQCLRCHNDRGHVSVFQARGCVGCHEDIHQGTLGTDCLDCHQETTWRPSVAGVHDGTRFPLVGVHATTQCWRCHPGAELGVFRPQDPDCASCHQADLARAVDPNHALLGWVNRCDRCHMPVSWNRAEADPALLPLPSGN